MVETNLAVIEGDWNDGDILREIHFMDDETLQKFIKDFEEIGKLYKQYSEEYNFTDYGEFSDWLQEYGGDEVENAQYYADIIDEYFPFEGNSQTGCKYITLNILKIITNLNDLKTISI